MVRPGTLTHSFPSTLAGDNIGDLPDFSIVGCPAQILRAISFCTSQRQNDTISPPGTLDPPIMPDVQGLQDTLFGIQNFDILQWAKYMVAVDPEPYSMPIEKLLNISLIWKLAAELYASRILYRVAHIDFPFSNMVDNIMKAYTPIAPDEELVKCIIWPVFVAGAESTRADQRSWSLSALDRIWNVVCGASVKNAQLVLQNLWIKQDHLQTLQGGESAQWDWIHELSSSKNHWLFF